MFHFQLHCLGISYHCANVDIREQLRFSLQDIKRLMSVNHESLNRDTVHCRFSSIEEIVLLSTCNRIELYVCTDVAVVDARSMLFELILEASQQARKHTGLGTEDQKNLTPIDLEEMTYHYCDMEAAQHLFRVACSLDSMVLGEIQILTQVKAAQENAREAGFIGLVLDTVFKAAHRVGKQARCLTSISCNPSSVSSAAVVLAKQSSGGDLSGSDVCVVGIGEMGKLALRTLVARGTKRLHVVNRTKQRAIELANHIKEHADTECQAYGIDELPEVLSYVDVVITAAAASGSVIGTDDLQCVMDRRREHNLIIVDIGVPRNVDANAKTINGVQLFDADDIRTIQDGALLARQKEIPKVLTIIDEEAGRLERSLRKLRMRPLIDELRQKAEAIRQHELERTYHKLGSPDPVTWSHVQSFSQALVKKLFHDPTTYIQEKAMCESADFNAATIRELFGLNKER